MSKKTIKKNDDFNNVKIELTEPQAKFIALQCRYPGFIAGAGAGKTRCMVTSAFMDSTHSSDAVIALYEPTYRLISDILVPAIDKFFVEMGVRYTHNKNEHNIYTSNGQMGDFILRSFENPELIVGYESYRSHVDEIDVVNRDKAMLAWNKIITRNRQWPKGIDKEHMVYSEKRLRYEPNNKVSAYSTPEGYNFTYEVWGLNKKKTDEGYYWLNPNYQYVQARTDSNPYVPEAQIEALYATYPEELVKAYLEGEWVNMSSGAMYRSYDRKLHSSEETVIQGESLYIGMDFNVRNMSATVWVKREGGAVWHAVEELTGILDTPTMINIIKERWQHQGHAIYVYPDASDPTHTTDASVSDIAFLRLAGFYVRAPNKNIQVRDRVSATNKAFEDGRLRVNSKKCPTVADCLENQCWKKDGTPDKDNGFDHQNDATTYPIAYEFKINRPMLVLPVSWAV